MDDIADRSRTMDGAAGPATKKTIRKTAKAFIKAGVVQAAMTRSLDAAIIAAKLNIEPERLPPG